MAISRRSDDSEGNGAIMGFEAMLLTAADKLSDRMDGNEERKKQIQLLGLNLGIAAADIVGVELLGASALATAFGSTIIFLSVAGFIYGNYKILTREKPLTPPPEWKVKDYVEALNSHRRLKTFEEAIDLLLVQIERLQKKNKTIRDILLQKFNGSEISYQKFDLVISEVEKIFFMNVRSILNKLDAFDEGDYIFIEKKLKEGAFSDQFRADKFEIRDKYITSVKESTDYNEQILLKVDKLLLEISDLDFIEPDQLEKMAGMIELDNLTKNAPLYKNLRG